MKFKTVKTILTAAQEKKQYGEIDLKSGSCCNFFSILSRRKSSATTAIRRLSRC